MKKITYLILFATLLFGSKAIAQVPCGTDEMRMRYIQAHPEIVKTEEEFNRQVQQAISHLDPSMLRTTAVSDTFWYDIPIVIHIVHDYNYVQTTNAQAMLDYLTDDYVFEAVKRWNQVYACQNRTDTALVIAPFKKYVGNARIRLHLATIDPNGNPTKGITRRRSYLTYNGSDQAKYDIWPPTSYVNIWVINTMSAANGSAAAYATPPSTAASQPYSDGVITLSGYFDYDNTINHEIGHIFSLIHPWGQTNQAQCGKCEDNGSDEVDDTPPTIGHFPDGCVYIPFTSRPPGCTPTYFAQGNIYDTICAKNYFKIYQSMSGNYDSLVNYPDTTNAQNIMDYTYCSKMFTKGQVARMHASLNSSIAGRNNLWSTLNLSLTGAMAPVPDLKPTPDYSVGMGTTTANIKVQYFTCPGVPIRISNRSYNDTLTKLKFVFSNTTATTDSFLNPTYNTFINKAFTDPGWVTVKATATGNHSGDSTVTRSDIFVTDKVPAAPSGYFQEFNPAGDLAKWPMFNYYNNEFKWELANVGLYDGYSMKYHGFDDRLLINFPTTGSPYGDYDDFFSIPFDLSSMISGPCNLNFYSCGASRSSNSTFINDTLLIEYSTDSAKTWKKLTIISKGDLCNRGAVNTSYVPTSMTDWRPQTVSIPVIARTSYTLFRFRYRPGVDGASYSFATGNNFYMDRIHFSPYAAEVSGIPLSADGITIAPNPTAGNAYVIIRNSSNSSAKIVVSDISGKTIYTSEEHINGSEARIEIPATVIATKGIYLVQTIAGGQVNTQKLVVY